MDMALDIPSWLMLLWQIVGGVSLALFLISFVFILSNKELPNREKMFWLLGSLLLPIVGPILFLTLGRYGK